MMNILKVVFPALHLRITTGSKKNSYWAIKYFLHLGLFNVNEKLFHMIGALFDKDGVISAMYETVEGHIDMNKRKIAPMEL